MIKFEQLCSIATGLAWANNSKPLDEQFEVNVILPFPFYEAIQNEIIEKMRSLPIAQGGQPDLEEMRFTKVVFPTGVIAWISKGEGGIIIEPKSKTPVIPMNRLGGNGLRPRA